MTEVVEQLRATRHSLLMVSPYFVPGESGTVAEEPGGSRRQSARVDEFAGRNRCPAGARRLRKISARPAETRSDAVRIEADRHSGNRRQPRIGDARAQQRSEPSRKGFRDRSTHCADRFDEFRSAVGLVQQRIGNLVESPELAAQVVRAFDSVTSSDRVWKMASDDKGLAWVSADINDASTLRSEPASFWRRVQVELLGPLAPEGYM